MTGSCVRETTCFKSSCQYSYTYILWCWEESTAHVMGTTRETSSRPRRASRRFQPSWQCNNTYILQCWKAYVRHQQEVVQEKITHSMFLSFLLTSFDVELLHTWWRLSTWEVHGTTLVVSNNSIIPEYLQPLTLSWCNCKGSCLC